MSRIAGRFEPIAWSRVSCETSRRPTELDGSLDWRPHPARRLQDSNAGSLGRPAIVCGGAAISSRHRDEDRSRGWMVVCLSGSGGFFAPGAPPLLGDREHVSAYGWRQHSDPWLRADRAGLIDGSPLQHRARTDRWLDGRRSIATSVKSSGRTCWRSIRVTANAEQSLPSRSDGPNLMLPIASAAHRAQWPIRGHVGADVLWSAPRPT